MHVKFFSSYPSGLSPSSSSSSSSSPTPAIMRPEVPLLLLSVALSLSLLRPATSYVHPDGHNNVPAHAGDAVDGICNQTSYKDLCLSSIQPFLPDVGLVDADLVLRLQMRAVRFRIKRVSAHLAKLLACPPRLPPVAGDPNAEKRYTSALGSCSQQINNDAVDSLSQASDALKTGNTYMFKLHLSAVTSVCDADFEGVAEIYWPALDIREIGQMVDNCMAIMRSISPSYDELPGGGRKKL